MTLRKTPLQILNESSHPLLMTFRTFPLVSLGKLATVTNGYAFPSSAFNTEARGIPIIRIRDVGADQVSTWFDGPYEPKYIVSNGEVIVGMDGDFRVARWQGPTALLNQRVCRIQVNDQIDERFLLHVLPEYLAAINEATSSVTVKHLSSNTILEMPIPLPGLDRQLRIVEAIEEQFSHLDAAKVSVAKVLNILDATRSSILSRAFGQAEPTR